jgi:Tfp pilus assembly protein PilN
MRELHLDYQDFAPFPWIGGGVLVCAAALLSLMWAHYTSLNAQMTVGLQQYRSTQQRSIDAKSAAPSAELAQQISNANGVLRQLSIPWEELFQAIESSGGNKVTLLTLEPDVEKLQVRISGETRNFKTLMNYIEQLQTQPVFNAVYLQHHQVQQDDAEKPVRFALLATWRDVP